MSEHDYSVDVQQLVLPDTPLPLAGWYAQPLTATAAAGLHAEARHAMQSALTGGAAHGQSLAARLAELIAAFWLGRVVALDYRSLIATHPPENVALVELIYGQLLISCKLTGALEHLERGFTLAVPHLAPADYFALLRRHELLRVLSLHPQPSAAQTLTDLLIEARVIRRLQPANRHRGDSPHDDTLG